MAFEEGFIFDWAEKIDSSGLPIWSKWTFYILLALLFFFSIGRRMSAGLRSKSEELDSTKTDPRVLEIAMTHKIFNDKIKKEKDPQKRKELEQKRDALIKKFKS